ncbi:MAG: sensor histidine kinase [Gaiellaceae bacterium]
MQHAVQAFRYLNIVAFIALGLVALSIWRRRRDRASMWAAATFGSLSLIELLGLLPNHSGNLAERGLVRVELAVLVLFPYLLFRFTTAFRRPGRELANSLSLLTVALVVWTFALPKVPQSGQAYDALFLAYLVVFMIHWTLLSIVSSGRLWRAGRQQPTVARRRMQLLALATAALTLALVFAVFTRKADSGLSLGSQIVATASVCAFLLGFAPPQLLRVVWRTPEQERMQEAIASLLTFAESQEEVASRVLEPAAAIVGARAAALRNAEGRIVGAWNLPDDAWRTLEHGDAPPNPWDDAEVVDVDVSGGGIIVWTSPYAPFFGDEELAILRTLGALTGLALDRVRLFQAEHQARLALERADEVKTNFIALAAHELRTPMTTIHGFVTTLHHLSGRLDDEQREQVREALLQQTQRMALLVEQLLDLSRLDADAIEIAPSAVSIRAQIEEIVAATAPDLAAVEIVVADDTIVEIDRNALDRIVSNLVTNAFRYGTPPVVVTAARSDRHFRVTVEDRGTGVPAQFVPNLFERFTRSEHSRSVGQGTGLGLAIARSYARAHGGDLLYEDATPHGARFQFVLPIR